MNNLPEIRIKFGDLLYATISKEIYELHVAKEDIAFMSKNRALELVEERKQAWKAKEKIILNGMIETFGIDFADTTIKVYLAPYVPILSDPLMISLRAEPDIFVDVLTHELFHRLLTENVQNIPYGKVLQDLYGNEDLLTRNHVFVHAGLAAIYKDVLGEPSRLERDIEFHQHYHGYKEAWDIVKKEGYQNLINKLKSYYR